MAAKLRGGSRDGHANGAERAGICIAGREGFSMHLEEERRAVLWGLFLPEILTYLGLG